MHRWRWGGCGDNLLAANDAVTQFVLAANFSQESRIRRIHAHNIAVGIKVGLAGFFQKDSYDISTYCCFSGGAK